MMAAQEDVERAVRSSTVAYPVWASIAAEERAAMMLAAADALDASVEERARLLCQEHGKPLSEALMDAGGASKILRYYAGLAEQFATPVVTEDHRGRIIRRRIPYGPTAVIAPWNAPIYLSMLMIAPTLVAGNTVVAKPSEMVPLACFDTLETLAKHLPEGVLNVVFGDATIGAALAAHPAIARISFTGSIPTGRALLEIAAQSIKPVSLELGGNDPALILEGARITDELIDELVKGVYSGSGQICYNVKRLYVHTSHYADFVDRFCSAVDELVVGDGLAPETTLGPVATVPQHDAVTSLLRRAEEGGAEVHRLGRPLDASAWDDGLFILPSVVTRAQADAEIVACEQFGPTVPIVPFEEESEAIRLANASDFGLAASVWDEDVDHAFEVAEQVDAGSVFVNIHRVGASDVSMEFGGRRQSGLGRGHGYVAVEEASEIKVIAQRTDMSQYRPATTDA